MLFTTSNKLNFRVMFFSEDPFNDKVFKEASFEQMSNVLTEK